LPPPDIAALPVVTRAELALHDGSRDPVGFPLWLAIDGVVLDVSGPEGQRFYAPGQDYAVFAGTDSTRALALGTLDDEDVARGDDVSDFDDWQRKELKGRILFYLEKYPAVGKLAPRGGQLASLLLAGDEAKEAASGFRL
jgi:membrane-associated progesterone receptor component